MSNAVVSLHFLSFKIDRMLLEIKNTVQVLLKKYSSNDWSFAVGIRTPDYIAADGLYIGGINLKLFVGSENDPEVCLQAGIAGVFKATGTDVPLELEESVVKTQIPGLLAPYLRAAVTNVLASSGFDSLILPLINFNALAEQQLKDIAINRIEPAQNPPAPNPAPAQGESL